MSKTIQIGIDLGTTNSALVAHIDSKYEVIKNSDQLEYTPSVFGYNK
jgi:molecular chaperone DnaK (HSP70)